MNKTTLTLAILSPLVISMILSMVQAQADTPTVKISTYRSEYAVGNPIAVAVEVSTSASVTLNIQTPSGTTTKRDLGFVEITYGNSQIFVLDGLTTTPGSYAVLAEATFPCYGGLKVAASSSFVVEEPGQITEVATPSTSEAPPTTAKEQTALSFTAQQTGLDVGAISLVAAAILLLSAVITFSIRRRKA